MIDITTYWQSINWLSLLLFPLSIIYRLLVGLRRLCFKLSCFNSHLAKVPVIIVGNISVGGNGKTPLLIYLVDEFIRIGYKPGVVSRGYGAINSRLDQGKSIIVDISKKAMTQGDEPWMIAKKTHCPVVVCRKRSQAVTRLIKDFNCDIIFSDDGLQHYAMGRDIEICVVDSSKNFGNGFCLPAGPLREPVSRLKEIDYIIYHQTNMLNTPGLAHEGFLSAEGSLPAEGSLLAEGSILAEGSLNMQLSFDQLHSLTSTDETISFDKLKENTIHAIAGIASPQRFFNQLKQAGFSIIEHPFSDHQQYELSDLEFNDHLPIVMTEKDAVKCIHFNLANSYYISVKVILSEDLVTSIIKKLKLEKRVS